jgi:carboxyl-terminal processing protease
MLEQAQSESYTEDIKKHISLLKEQVQYHRTADLQKFKKEIKLLLEETIVAQYYFQEGIIEAMLEHDRNIQRSCTLLQNMHEYHALLQASFSS